MRARLLGAVVLAAGLQIGLSGCTPNRGDADPLAVVQEQRLLEQSTPELTVWVRNQSGRPLTHVSFNYRLAETTAPGSGATYSADAGFSRDRERLGEPAEQVWSKGWPNLIAIHSVRVRVGGVVVDHRRGYEARPGERVLIDVGKDGKVTVGPWSISEPTARPDRSNR